jgi:hypothetical protein
MSIKSIILQYPLKCKYAIDILAGYKRLKDLIFIKRFNRTLKSLLLYLKGLHILLIKIISLY